jgi:iron(II)-dependent oxidoreductase
MGAGQERGHAVRVLQRHRHGDLGEHLGDLERNDPARFRGRPARGKIDRKFSGLLVSADWQPHTPAPLQSGIYASKYPGTEQTLWTIVNKNEFDVAGEQMRIPHNAGRKYYDVWHGVELKPDVKDNSATLSFEIEGNGYGAVLASDAASTPADLQKILGEMNTLARTRLNSYSRERRFLPQQVVTIPPTRPARNPPAAMVRIPAGEFEFQVSGIEIEGSNEVGVDVQYPWENSPRRDHRTTMNMKSFYMERNPVTNAEFKKFVDAAKYRPGDDHNFLKDWQNGTYPAGWENKPVTWVSLEDARAYAAWAGKRLPHEWEWQYAAQGADGRTYPWGERLECSGRSGSGSGPRSACAGQCGRSPARGEPVWGDGPDR